MRLVSELFTSLDLEMNQPSGKIISIGYCIGNIHTKEILKAEDLFVSIDEPLNPEIISLTGISESKLKDQGQPLIVQFEKLKRDHLDYGCFINPIVWGGGDSKALMDQLDPAIESPFGRRWIDVKTVFITRQLAKKLPFFGGLAKSMGRLGLKFKGKKHSSKDDAINTFMVYCKLLEEMKDE